MTKRVGSADAGNPERCLASGPGVINDGRGVPSCAVTIDGDREPVNAATVQFRDHDGFFLAPVLTPVAGGIEAVSGSVTAAVRCATFPVLTLRLIESACAADAEIASGNALVLSPRVVPRGAPEQGGTQPVQGGQSAPGASRAPGWLRQREL